MQPSLPWVLLCQPPSSLAWRSVHEEVPPPQPGSQGAGTRPTPEQGQSTPSPTCLVCRNSEGAGRQLCPSASNQPAPLAMQALIPRASRAGQRWLVSLGKEDYRLPFWVSQWLQLAPKALPYPQALPPALNLPSEHRLLLLSGPPRPRAKKLSFIPEAQAEGRSMAQLCGTCSSGELGAEQTQAALRSEIPQSTLIAPCWAL